MWLSTKRSVDGGKQTGLRSATSPISSTATESSKVRADDDDNNIICDWRTTLPLDWTQLSQLKRTSASDNNNNNNNSDDDDDVPKNNGRFCCMDPSTCRKRHIRPRLDPQVERTTHDTSKSESTVSSSSSAMAMGGNDTMNDHTNVSLSDRLEGLVMFCLPETDPSWMQGYFLPRGTESKKPWRLLAIQEEVDECLACSDGGYRRLSLTVYPSTTTNFNNDNNSRRRIDSIYSYKIEGVDWIGGDMMSLYHPQDVEMEGERLLTGTKALPILKKYFQGLVRRLKEGRDDDLVEDDDVSVLTWLPDVAIVTGSMSLSLPTSDTK